MTAKIKDEVVVITGATCKQTLSRCFLGKRRP
jgi:hypothetical protein